MVLGLGAGLGFVARVVELRFVGWLLALLKKSVMDFCLFATGRGIVGGSSSTRGRHEWFGSASLSPNMGGRLTWTRSLRFFGLM